MHNKSHRSGDRCPDYRPPYPRFCGPCNSPGPIGPVGPIGPTGPTGSNASIVTQFTNGTPVILSPGTANRIITATATVPAGGILLSGGYTVFPRVSTDNGHYNILSTIPVSSTTWSVELVSTATTTNTIVLTAFVVYTM
jgi:hypothetical protein